MRVQPVQNLTISDKVVTLSLKLQKDFLVFERGSDGGFEVGSVPEGEIGKNESNMRCFDISLLGNCSA